MRVLVTGSSGFIGRNLAALLHREGFVVAGLDWKLNEKFPGASFYRADLLDKAVVVAALTDFRPDALVHLAARTSLKEVGPDSDRYAANTAGTQNVIDACSTAGVTRAIFTSTKYVHRDGGNPAPRTYSPTTSYGRSKALMEEIVWHSGNALPEWCITRPTTIWGPGMGKHYQNFLRMLLKGRYVHIGRKVVLKHMGYVENTAHQYKMLLTAPSERIHRQIFYLADYDPMVLRDWAEILNKALGGPPIRTIPYSLAKSVALIGDVVSHTIYRKFAFTSFRLDNLTRDDLCDVGPTKDVCGVLPRSAEEGAAPTAEWFRPLATREPR
jgi:nucleoside-diphosphate-sugar epimerase